MGGGGSSPETVDTSPVGLPVEPGRADRLAWLGRGLGLCRCFVVRRHGGFWFLSS